MKTGLTYKGWKFIKTGTVVQVAIELASCHFKKFILFSSCCDHMLKANLNT